MNSEPEALTRPRETLAPSPSLAASAIGGMPLAVFTVSLLNRTVFSSHPLGVEEAVAIGSVGAAVFGYLFHVGKTLIDRAILKS